MATRKAKTLTLTQALSQLLAKTLLPDLRERAAEPAIEAALRIEHEREVKAERTADSFREFVERTLEQVGAAWVLGCVFVRTLEDRSLLARNRLAGEGALDSEQLFFELAPSLTARDYLLTVFTEIGSLPGAEDVLGRQHNPVYRLSPSNDGARALLDFFRQRDEAGALRWTFGGDDTRFLGDLYQDLSEDVRKRYALLQTPAFVESFILDQTLTPAIAEYGYAEVRLIDPTCGSGHFVLGAFERLLDERLRNAPGVDTRTHALDALQHVYGVDVNPYAVAIARFRLTLAYLARAGFTLLQQAPKLQLNLVVADSLVHGAQNAQTRLTEQEGAREDEAAFGFELFALDDPAGAARVFGQLYHAVVGNPPYITCKDAKLRSLFIRTYESCAMNYALSVPFTERFFQLAVDSGFVGMINANSFMKREFGKALIERVLPRLDLDRVIDTAGAFIPGHGTPTVLLFGRNRKPAAEQVSAVLGKRGEPNTPDDPAQGLVWRSIADHFEEIGFDNDYVSVVAVPRSTLNQHPWSLGGGGAAELKELLEVRATRRLSDVIADIGFSIILGEDEVFLRPTGRLQWAHLPRTPLVIGEEVRDWSLQTTQELLRPFDPQTMEVSAGRDLQRELWPWKATLRARIVSGSTTMEQSGREWFDVRRLSRSKHVTPLSITFAEVATHNHFVLDSGRKVFNRTAPIIKLPESATEDDHLALLAYLNSSTACFWMKQVCFPKMSGTNLGEVRGQEDRIAYQFAGTALSKLPVPPLTAQLADLGRRLTNLACERALCNPTVVLGQSPTSSSSFGLAEAKNKWDDLRNRMVSLQEALDWYVYDLFALLDSPTGPRAVGSTGMRPDERPFLVALEHVAVAPSAFLLNRWIALIERPIYKRPWFGRQGVFHRDARAYDDLVDDEREQILFRRIEARIETAGGPIPVRQLIAYAKSDEDQSGAPSASDDHALTLVISECIPFLDSLTLTEIGHLKRCEWKQTWDLQRREDLGENVGYIPVPPKYDVKDFRDPNYFRLRGKLDVPKERFISYPGCQKDGDPSPLIGWAGWNHLQRAQALIALYQERKLEDGWETPRLMPMLVGLHELMFWLELWHSAPEAGSENPAREVGQYLAAELSAHRLTTADLEAWRPEPKKARKSAKRASRTKPEQDAIPEEDVS